MGSEQEPAITVASSAGVGFLVGLERERNPTAKAGVRTFTLIAVLGTLCALLAGATSSGWILGVGAAVVGASITTAYALDRSSSSVDFGTTTVVAAILVFTLGAVNDHGNRTLTVAVGVATTVVLHFKAEIEGFSHRLTPQDIRSALQFAVLSAVVLPLLPNQPLGPYGA